jgi:hypothetical protein
MFFSWTVPTSMSSQVILIVTQKAAARAPEQQDWSDLVYSERRAQRWLLSPSGEGLVI